MKLRLVEPVQGARWVRDGVRAFLKFPLAFASILAAGLFAMLALSLLPFIGIVVLLVLLPTGNLVFMVASRLAARGEAPIPSAFIEVLRSPRQQRIDLLKLGLVYAAGTVLVMWAANLIDGGALEAVFNAAPSSGTAAGAAVAAEKLVDPRLPIGILCRFAFAALIAVPLWHAPALVHWGGLGWSKALFFSTVACWRNKGAFAVYLLVWAAVMVVVMMSFGMVLALFGQGRSAIIAMPVSLVMSTVFYATLYFSFAACFDTASPAEIRSLVA